ncbi:unnamed protein product [Caenorhabditis nigoni]
MLTTFFSCFRFRKTRNNEEANIGKEPASEQKVAEKKSSEENEQKFEQLSDRLQSIEASISKIQQMNEAAQKSKYVKQFKLKYVFEDVDEFEKNEQSYSEWEDHYNVKWSMKVRRYKNHLGFFIRCEPITPADKWSIQIKSELKVVGPNQHDVIRTYERCHKNSRSSGFIEFLGWEEMNESYLVNGNLQVESKITIVETTGLGKEKTRQFDESQKDVSDVILVVRDTKFYVSKMFLASQSSVFKALLLGNFSESQKSEVTLNGIDPDDFHYFLECLYGESAIDDTTVAGVGLLADMYDVPTVIRRCEKFLLKESKKTMEQKLEIATQCNLETLKEKCEKEIDLQLLMDIFD